MGKKEKRMNRKELLEALTALKPCIKKNNIIPTLSNVSFSETSIEVFNGIQGIKVDFDSGINCSVDGTDLLKIISSLTGEEIHLNQEESSLKIVCGKAVYTINAIKPSYYFPPDDEINYSELPESFIEGLKKCSMFSSKSITPENRYGVTVKDNVLYSTNGIGIAKFTLEQSTGLKHIFSEPFIRIISSMKGDDFMVGRNDKAIFILGQTCRVFSMLNEVNLLDYEKVLKKYNIDNLIFTQITDELKETIKRMSSIFHNTNELIITSNDNGLSLYQETTNLSSVEIIDFRLDNDFSSKFDIDLVLKLIENNNEIATVIIDKDIILIGKSKEFLCIVVNIL